MDRVRVRLLGDFSVELDDLTVTAASFERRAGALLVQMLSLAPARSAHREQVIDALWPDADLRSGMNRLNKAATFARNALGRPDTVVVRNETLHLLPDQDVWIDVEVVATADRDDPHALAEAVDAARGELLPHLPYDDWVAEPRARLHLAQLDVLREAGEWDRVLALEPADETAHLAQMRAALDRGDRATAIRQYEALETALAERLGLVPSAAAETLRRQADAPTAGATPATGDAPSIRTVMAVASDDPDSVRVEVFDAIAAAVDAAVAAQRSNNHSDAPVGIGLDLGPVEDERGDAVDRAKAIARAAADGQVLCSGSVADLAPIGRTDGLSTVELGLFAVADLAPTRVHRLAGAGLPSVSAPPRLAQLRGRSVPPSRVATFGRSEERRDIAADLAGGRLVTIVGPGGAGKTHLGSLIASDLLDSFPGGAWMCELGNVDDERGAAQEILAAVGGLHQSDTTVVESIVSALRTRRALVLLDNCEHVLDAVRAVVDAVRTECPDVAFLATSRQPLAVGDEVVHRLDPLGRDAAVEMFVAETRRHGGVEPTDVAAIERICDRLDDLPLALRLAAARSRSVDLTALEALLADRFEFLGQVEDGALEHQQTLRTTIAWSVHALDRATRDVLTALGVFANRFDLDAAAAVTGLPLGHCIRTIDELVRRSLVIGPQRSNDGTAEYRLLESVRLFVREDLGDDVRVRHLEHLVESVQRWNSEIGSKQNRGLAAFDRGWDDIRLALGTAIDRGRRDDVVALLAFTGLFGNLTMRFELLEWYERGLSTTVDAPSRFELVARSGWSVLATYHGDFDLARSLIDQVVSIEPELPEAAWAMAWLPWTVGDLDETRTWLNRILESDDPGAVTTKFAAMHLLSIVDFADGKDISEPAMLLDVLSTELGASARSLALASRGLSNMWTDGSAAIADAEECIALSDAVGLINTSMTARSVRALATTVHRPLGEAAEVVGDTLRYAGDRGLWSWVYAGSGTAAALFERAGRPDAATVVLAARDAADYRSGFTARLVILLEQRLRDEHPDAVDTWWRVGSVMSRQALLDYILRTADDI